MFKQKKRSRIRFGNYFKEEVEEKINDLNLENSLKELFLIKHSLESLKREYCIHTKRNKSKVKFQNKLLYLEYMCLMLECKLLFWEHQKYYQKYEGRG